MNKIFNSDSIVAVEDYFVVVDKDEIKNGDWNYNPSLGEVGKFMPPAPTNYNPAQDDCLKVIATLYKRLDDVPLIELPDEADEIEKQLLDKVFIYNDDISKRQIYKTLEIFKAAQSKGRYSVEDVVEIITKIVNDGDDTYELVHNGHLLAYIKNLQPKRRIPTSITLEMEYPSYKYDENNVNSKMVVREDIPMILKITNPETNSIIPIEVKY